MPFASLTLLRSVPVATETAVTATPGTLAPVGSTMTPRIAPVLAVWAKTGLSAIHATNIAGKQNFSLRIRGRIRIGSFRMPEQQATRAYWLLRRGFCPPRTARLAIPPEETFGQQLVTWRKLCGSRL